MTAARLADLRAQMVGLREQRRSYIDFREWKADPFYYSFAVLGAALPAVLIGFSGKRFWTILLSGCVFLLLCYLPQSANYLRYHFLVRLPNRRLQRQIDSVAAEIDRLKET